MSATVWKSDRLVYRPAETADDAFLAFMSQDAQSYTQAAPFLPKPQGDANGTGTREWINKCFLGVLICEPVPGAPTTAAEAAIEAAKPRELDADGKEKPRPKPKPVGYITLMADDARMHFHRKAEIGITIALGFQGKGYGSEAIEWALRWGFQYAGLHRISIGAFSWNTRAVALYRRLGFVDEGVSREAWWFNGKFWDAHSLAMLDWEWREREAAKAKVVTS